MISAIFVSYLSARLARRAIASLRADAPGAEVVVVENSGLEEEAALLEDVADVLVRAPRNLGYAGGINAGVNAASGDLLLFSNPDVLFREGSIAALFAEAGPLVMTGPALFWDEGLLLALPPAEDPNPRALLRRELAGTPRLFHRDVRRGLAALEDAERGLTREARGLSGAVLATRRDTFERVGPFDEGFALYYEENDWQRRLRALGGTLLRVGAAHVVHHYNQSAQKEPRAAEWFGASERRYFEKHFGEAGRVALARPRPEVVLAEPPREVLLLHPEGTLVAVSPLRSFHPTTLGRIPGGVFRLPADVHQGAGDTPLYARLIHEQTFATLAEAVLR